jgi:hypothetical protein
VRRCVGPQLLRGCSSDRRRYHFCGSPHPASRFATLNARRPSPFRGG